VNKLPDGARVLFLWETRSLYCDEPRITCEEDTVLYRWWHDRRTVGDGSAEAIVDDWRAKGITHMLVWNTGRDFEFDNNNPLITQADKAEWAKVPPLLEVVWPDDDEYTLYALPDGRE
jgi:hypothetical protein